MQRIDSCLYFVVQLIFIYTNNIYSSGLQDGDYCTTVEYKAGTCKNIEECDYMWEMYQCNDRNRTPSETKYILKSQCGQKGRSPLICCENGRKLNGRVDTSLSRVVPEPISGFFQFTSHIT